ncbi:MAG TPA: folate-binding protein [Kineosporiaceae bacterium]|nr:folate-binding protein [Kineosporiaceae bacterium]
MNVTPGAPALPAPPPSPLLARPGAVPGEGADAPVAWHYGDPSREQRRLESAQALVDLSHRGVLRIAGPDRLSWLHSLTTQALTGLRPGVSTQTLVLSPHGHIEHDLHLVDDGEAAWVTVEPGTVAELAGWLDRMRFMLRVEVADVTGDWAVVGSTGAWTPDAGGPVTPPAWTDPWPALGPATASYAAVAEDEHPGAGRTWREVLVPRDGLVAALTGQDLAGTWAAEALRVAAWRPRLGFETDHRTIPHELDWLRTAVHLQKGCYRGQETVARVHNLGRPPRRLVLLHLDGSENVLPATGDPVQLAGRSVGHVTTPVRHHELGPVALALVKRSVPADAVLVVAGVPAAQELVVAP